MAGWLMISVVGINIVTNFMISIVYNIRSKIEMCKRSKFRVSQINGFTSNVYIFILVLIRCFIESGKYISKRFESILNVNI